MKPASRAAVAVLALSTPALTWACGAGSPPPVTAPASAATAPPSSSASLPTPPAPGARPSCPDGMVGVAAPPAAAGAGGQPPDPFCIDATEVTAADYAACMKAGTCPPRNESCVEGLVADEGAFPARCMSWNEAAAYCATKGRRLPTDPEWILAACGTDGRKYPWGNEEPTTQVCWMGAPGGFHGTTQRGPCRVGSFPAGRSPYGMLDAAGNVEEWTATTRDKFDHVVRGGSYSGSWLSMQCANGVGDMAGNINRGFRCAASPR